MRRILGTSASGSSSRWSAYVGRPASLGAPPLRLLWFQTFDNVLIPIPLKTLQLGVEAAIPVIQDGHAVLVFCMYGRHRSVAMAAAILIGMGHSAEDAMRMLERSRVAGGSSCATHQAADQTIRETLASLA